MPSFAEHLAALPADNAAELYGDGQQLIRAPFVENAGEKTWTLIGKASKSRLGHCYGVEIILRKAIEHDGDIIKMGAACLLDDFSLRSK